MQPLKERRRNVVPVGCRISKMAQRRLARLAKAQGTGAYTLASSLLERAINEAEAPTQTKC